MFGHPVGDMMMRAAAERLVAEADGAFVARIGGDEFMILVPDDIRREDVLRGRAVGDFTRALCGG